MTACVVNNLARIETCLNVVKAPGLALRIEPPGLVVSLKTVIRFGLFVELDKVVELFLIEFAQTT